MSTETEYFAGPDLESEARSSWRRLLRFFARRGIVGPDAEDAVQDVFARLARAARFNSREHLQGYLFTTAASVAVDHVRRRNSRATLFHEPMEDEQPVCAHPGPDQQVSQQQTLERVAQALQELPERTRVIFIMARLEGCQYADISRRTGVSTSAVEKHMIKATRHLAARLRGYRS